MNNITTVGNGPFNPSLKMTSLEIAELMEKNHQHVMRDIRNLIDQGALAETNFGQIFYLDSMNREQPMYVLDFQATMLVITGYDANRRAIVIDRWMKLETGKAVPLVGLHEQLIDTPVINNLISALSDTMTMVGKLAAKVEQLCANPGARQSRQIHLDPEQAIARFVNECCVVKGSRHVKKIDLYGVFRAWCTKNEELVETYDTFFKLLYRIDVPMRSSKMTIADRQERVVKGLGLIRSKDKEA
ncbi:MAG: hypothetical protein FP810_15390 [Desulfocapsa sp.]|nr:hypothetical protein [Desulfocapsa sp.]